MEQKESRIIIRNEDYDASIDGYTFKIYLDDEKGMVFLRRENPLITEECVIVNCSYKEAIALREVLSDVIRRIWMHEQSDEK